MALPPRKASIEPAPDGDVGAWMAEYGQALRWFFTKRVGQGEAEDLVQEVFLRLQARARGEAVENVERYLFRIANNVLVDRFRHEASHGTALADPMDFGFDVADEMSPERALMAKQTLSQISVALRELPPRTRDAFIYHRFEEMTYPLIARRMGISVNGVEKLIKRALAQLAQKVERRR
ncbi:MAG TPA: sigma-70 family RNA polymerase sigma factor [Caulobacteraceae bacterium]|nr:sigma-70 family RNA polymerase sigma factor [Caulobacteraceae bacterium]